MRTSLLLVSMLALCGLARAQSGAAGSLTFAADSGAYSIAQYADNIFRISFRGRASTQNEQLSDAVILKPVRPGRGVRVRRDSVYLLNLPFVVKSYVRAGERGFYFPLAPGEMIFGGGERALPLNRRGYRLNLYNNPWYGYGLGADNLNYSVPFITSSRGYALFFDNPSKGYIDIGREDSSLLHYGASSGELNVYVILGNYRQILQSYYRLTGTQPLPPRWALGNLMSRFGYTGEAQVTGIAAKMKDAGLPIDAVIFDLFWFGDSIKGTMGNLDWVNKTQWPDPAGMISRFRRQNVHTVLVTEPFFLKSARNYEAAERYLATDSTGRPYTLTDFYFGRGGLVDIFRKDAQQWFWTFYERQAKMGVEGWWSDLGEPEKHPADLYHNLRDYGYTRRFRADEVHNIYGHSWTRMLYNRYAEKFPGQRLFSLNRSGFAGSQRYSIFPWTGDVSRSWSGFQAQLPLLLGMSMSGVPYVHSDAGGFAGGEGDGELYVRWLQFAVYTPIFRPHGTALYEKDPGAFSFPSEAALIDSPYQGYARAAIRNRYALLPYNYSLAFRQAASGEPLMSPLYYYFPLDTTAAQIEDEYMWGEHILVAPVLQKGAGQRRYYLPGGNWYNPVRQSWAGPGWQVEDVAIDYMPVLYRAGSFIPQTDYTPGGAPLSNTAADHGDHLLVNYIVSPDSSAYELYDDDGHTKQSIGRKQYELIRFSSSGMKAGRLALYIRSNGGRYPGRPPVRTIRLLVRGRTDGLPAQVLVNGHAADAGSYTRTAEGVVVSVQFTGTPVRVQLAW